MPYRFLMSFVLSAALFLSLGSSPAVEEQYSANSLITSFTSRNSLKGASITLTDVVTETQIGRLIFRSAGNDKVVCELRSGLPKGSGVAAGNTLTVVGRVRGRGALGNVTLDDCSVAVKEPVTVAQPTEIIPEPAPLPIESPAVLLDEPLDEASDHSPQTRSTQPARIGVPLASNVNSNRRSPRPSSVPNTASSPAVAAADNSSEFPDSTIMGFRSRNLAYALGALGGFLAALIFVAFLKVAPSIFQSKRPVHAASTPEMRRLALEALLSREKKA